MISSVLVGAVALCGAVSAAVAAPPAATITAAPVLSLQRRDPAGTLDPWVSVNEDPSATTLTPKWTTDSKGESSLKDAAPSSLTGSVFSFTTLGEPTTTTGDPPNPTTDKNNKKGSGAFSLCQNKDGVFCRPRANSTLAPGNVYYLTWDPERYVSKSNESYSLTVQVQQFNTSSNKWEFLSDFDNKQVPAKDGYFPFDVTDKLLGGGDKNNITVTLQRRVNNTIGDPDQYTDPWPLHVAKIKWPSKAPNNGATGYSLTIALPVVFGTIFLLVIGLCLWNRKTRRIQLGDVLSRKNRGYSGRSERRRRMFDGATDAEHDIQLGNGFPDDGPAYRDAPARGNNNLHRRGSDGLDSLTASPVHESFQQQGTTGGRNAFRDEMDRQHNERTGAL